MSPEEHFRRLQNPDVWTTVDDVEHTSLQHATTAPALRRSRTPVWATAAVAAAVVLVGAVAIQAGARTSSGGAPAGPAVAESSAAPTLETRSPAPLPSTSPRPAYEFVLTDPKDAARARAELACYKSHGVKIVEMTRPDADGISYIAYGGAHNDKRSITLGLQYQHVCEVVGLDAVK